MINLPSFDEVPRLHPRGSRDNEALMRIAMIPPEDAAIRAVAVAIFLQDEHDSNASEGVDQDKSFPLLVDTSHTAAMTPGGIAWKIATVTDWLKPDQEESGYKWWWNCLFSAISDALDLERERQTKLSAQITQKADISGGASSIVSLAEELERLNRSHIDDDHREEILDRIAAIEIELSITPAATHADLVAKARVLAWWEQEGIMLPKGEPKLAKSLLYDLMRLGEGSEPR